MLTITCPVCSAEGDESDFEYGGQAHIARPATGNPANVTDEAQRDYLYHRKNPMGVHYERWLCARGCGKWFHAARHTVTLEFEAFYGITEPAPPSSSSASKATRTPRRAKAKAAKKP